MQEASAEVRLTSSQKIPESFFTSKQPHESNVAARGRAQNSRELFRSKTATIHQKFPRALDIVKVMLELDPNEETEIG
jgi:hypothetical protein